MFPKQVVLIVSLSLSFVLFFSIIMLLGASPGPCHYGLLISYSMFSPTGVNTHQGLLNLHSPVHPVNIWSHPRQEDLPPFVKVPKSLKNNPPRPQWWHVLSAGSNQFNSGCNSMRLIALKCIKMCLHLLINGLIERNLRMLLGLPWTDL